MSATLVQICYFRIHHDKDSKIGNKIGKTEEKDIRYMGAVSQSSRRNIRKYADLFSGITWETCGKIH